MSVDRRAHPRYPVNLKVSVRPAEIAGDFSANATMLSRNSVQLMCEANLVMALVKHGQPPYLCELGFEVNRLESPLVVGGQVLTHRRISQQQYVLVFLFRQLDERQQAGLDQLLIDMTPASAR